MAMKCKCEAMAKLMAFLGAKHAAKMHRNPDADWTIQDWLMHFAEEDEYVLPRLPRAIAIRIYREHEIMRAEIRVFGRIVSIQLLEKHAREEDEDVLKYLGHLVQTAA